MTEENTNDDIDIKRKMENHYKFQQKRVNIQNITTFGNKLV